MVKTHKDKCGSDSPDAICEHVLHEKDVKSINSCQAYGMHGIPVSSITCFEAILRT